VISAAARPLSRSGSIPRVNAGTSLVTVDQLQQLLDHDSAFTKSYGFLVTAVSAGSCSLDVPHLPHFERPGGIMSGQVLMTAADVAMWLAIKTLRGIDDTSVTSHMQTDFLEGAHEPFTCNAVVLKLGRRTSFGTAECVSKSGTLLAHHTMSYIMPAKQERHADQ
jgi:acyl-coenzyme A thioesterase PaaI-like protein